MGTIARYEPGYEIEEGWLSVDLSKEQLEEERVERADAQAVAVYSRVLDPVAFAVCVVNAPSVSLAFLGFTTWKFFELSVTARCTQIWRAKLSR